MLNSIKLFSSRSQHGFSMVELLVTMLIFTIGFLGVASMQVVGMRLTYDAGLMGQASLLANNLADKFLGQGSLQGVSVWQQQVKETLPQGMGDVEQSGRFVTISVDWLESQNSSQQTSRRHYELSVVL